MAKRPFESKIQDLVYNLDTGLGLRLIQGGLGILVLLLVVLLYSATQFRGLKDAEAMDYAQLGRNLMETKRYVTENVRPASLWYLQKNKQIRPFFGHPETIYPPVYPAVLAGGFALFKGAFQTEQKAGTFPPEQWVIQPINHIFTLMTGVLVLLLGRRLFSAKIGLLGMVVYLLSNCVWQDSISGLGLSLLTFLGTAAAYAMLVAGERREEHPSVRHWIVPFLASAAFCTLAILTRYAALVLIPGLMLFVAFAFGRRGWAWGLLFMALVLAGISPWLARNVVVTGGPFGLAPYLALENADLFVGPDGFQRATEPVVSFLNSLHAMQRKFMLRTALLYSGEIRGLAGTGLFMSFFVVSYFFRFSRKDVRLLRWAAALSILLLAAAAAVFSDFTWRAMAMFLPLIILYGLAFFFLLLDRMKLQIRLLNIAVLSIVVLLSSLPMIFALLPPKAEAPYPPYFPPFVRHVSAMLQPNEMIATDMPWATAWYGHRHSLYLPMTVDEFYKINDYQQRLSGAYFTTLTTDLGFVRTLRTGPLKTWFPVLEGRLPNDFPLTQGFPLNNADQLFLTDKPRWSTQQNQP